MEFENHASDESYFSLKKNWFLARMSENTFFKCSKYFFYTVHNDIMDIGNVHNDRMDIGNVHNDIMDLGNVHNDRMGEENVQQ